jgi:hypothetical protein
MPWKECHVMDERLRFVARLLEGEKMAPLPSTLTRVATPMSPRSPPPVKRVQPVIRSDPLSPSCRG